MRKRHIVNLNVLPGQPLDGSGKVCIHLFVPDERGPFVEPHCLSPALDKAGQPIKGQVIAGPKRGRLACNPKRKVAPVHDRGVTTVTLRTDDPRAVSCPKCKETRDYTKAMEPYIEDVARRDEEAGAGATSHIAR